MRGAAEEIKQRRSHLTLLRSPQYLVCTVYILSFHVVFPLDFEQLGDLSYLVSSTLPRAHNFIN